MSPLQPLPEKSIRRLSKVSVRTIHLVGIAGVFGSAMTHAPEPVYATLAIVSGIVLVIMEAYGSLIWFVQIRAVSVYLKLLLLLLMHLYQAAPIPWLIAAIVLSGVTSHAPSWIRYYSLRHGKVMLDNNELLG